MKIEPYLFFSGRCDEALAFYKSALGAELTMLMQYKDNPEPPSIPLPAGWEDKVTHAALKIGEMQLMASEGCEDRVEPGFQGVSLSLEMPDAATAHRAFDALADSGTVQMPLAKTFFAPCFGMLTDRFGLGWMVIVNEKSE